MKTYEKYRVENEIVVTVLPDPLLTTSETGTPSSCAMKPSTEKMANPANTEVKQLPKQTIIVSLKCPEPMRKLAMIGSIQTVVLPSFPATILKTADISSRALFMFI